MAPSASTSGIDAPSGRVVRVVPDVSGVRRAFDYIVPAELDDQVRVGTSVRVRLHNRRVVGWVVAEDVEPPAGVTLVPILGVRGWGPPSAVVDIAQWAAWRWAGPPSRLLGTASAPTVVRAVPAPRLQTAQARSSRTDALAADALSGGVSIVRLAPARDPFDLVLAAVHAGLAGAIDPSSSKEPPGVLVLAPAQEQASRLAAHVRRAGHPVALVPGQWAQARGGGCVAIGSRAAAFAPLPALGAAVVLDAHDEAYHEERSPTWSAWQVVVERARRAGAPCVLVSPCPTLDLLHHARLVTTSRVEERAGWPIVEAVDRRSDDPRSGLYSERLVALVRWAAAEPGRQVLCVLNRTGRVRLAICAVCGEPARCERCGAAVESVVAQGGILHCRRCGLDRPGVCAHCGSARLAARRVGVTRVREELEALTRAAVVEVTGASGGAGAGDDGAVDGGAVNAAAVVVGTEALLHRVGHADAVAFLDFDAEMLAPRMRAAEEALALLARAARIVAQRGVGGEHGPMEHQPGRDSRAPGRVLVQTRQPAHPALLSAVMADPGLLAAAEAPVRAELRLPPVTAMAIVSGPAADDYGQALAAAADGVEVHGPVDGVWSLRADTHQALCDLLDRTPRPAGRVRVEVDPVRA